MSTLLHSYLDLAVYGHLALGTASIIVEVLDQLQRRLGIARRVIGPPRVKGGGRHGEAVGIRGGIRRRLGGATEPIAVCQTLPHHEV